MNCFDKFIKAQIKFINDAKWFEGIKRHCDPGQPYVESWIKSSAADFRDHWNHSQCSHCENADRCGDLLKICCESFIEMEEQNEI